MPDFLKEFSGASQPFLAGACLAILLTTYLSLLLRGEKTIKLASRPARACAAMVLGFLSFYLLYGIAAGPGRAAWIPVTYVVGAGILAFLASRHVTLGMWDLLFVLWVWWPIDAGWLQTGWPWPAGARQVVMIPFAVLLAVYLSRRIRGWEHAKVRLSATRREIALALKYLCAFLLLAIPFGLWTNFIQWNGGSLDAGRVALTFLGILLLVAVPEEFLFRGLIYAGLAQRFKNPRLALWGSSLVFGLAHLNNGSSPDWRYGVLATVAGVFYAKAFTAGRNFSAAVIMHTLVDVIWVNLFR